MNRSRILTRLPLAMLVLMAWQPALHAQIPSTAGGRTQAVDVTSHLRATTADGAAVALTLRGVATHTQTGLRVVFTAKQLLAVDPGNFGPITVTLNPRRASEGKLSSAKFPATHRQSFFLQIQNERWGTLVSDAPITLSARIDSSPPTATYKSAGGDVAFYKVGDPGKKPALTVHEVTSEVKPAASQAVDIKSRVTATVAGKPVRLQLNGTAIHILGGTSVIFTNKLLRAVNPGDIGPIRVTLNSRQPSVGTLSSPRFPATHRQSFFLQIQSERLGTLVSDEPLVVSAQIESSPPTATYKSDGKPVAFYKRGDAKKRTVLTFDSVESEVTPPARKGGY